MPKCSEGRIALGGLAAIFIWAFIALPILYYPPPHSAEISRQELSRQPQRATEGEPKGTEQSPLFIKLLPGPKTAEEVAQEAEDRNEKASADRWVIIFNGLIALFTAALVGANIALWRAGEHQIRLIGDNAAQQSKDMQASVAAAERAASGAMIGARAAQKSAETAEKAFSNLERPYVFAFGVRRLEADTERVGGFEPFVTYSVANYGKTPAIIENVRVGFSIGEFHPDGPTRVDDTNDLLISPIMGAGERRDDLIEIFPAGMERTLHRDEAGKAYAIPAMKSAEDLFFRIIIDYRGAFSHGHECGFCWRYNRATGHFVQHGHEDYNYVA
jgi:hypothetical protein